jgi:long-chain acyl-CoA synthetase
LTAAGAQAILHAMEARIEARRAEAVETATMPRWFHAALQGRGPETATLQFRDGAFREGSWSDLRERVELVARGLIDLGIEPGDRVSILSSSREEWSWFDYGAQCAGATVVPIYQTNSPAECEHILRDAGVRLVLCEDAEQLAKVEQVRGALPALERVVVVEPADGTTTLEELQARGAAHRGAQPDAYAARWHAIGPDEVCTIVYTSGTTGPPKGCVILHRNYHAMVRMLPERIVEGSDLIYLYLPLAHAFARLIQFASVDYGATLAYSRGTQRIPEDLKELRPTVLPSVPRVFEKVYHAVLSRVEESSPVRQRLFRWAVRAGRGRVEAELAGHRLGSSAKVWLALAHRLVLSKIRSQLGGRVRLCISGGAPVSPEILEFFAACGITVLEGYGLTETSTAAAINSQDALRFGTVGRPLSGVEARIADDGEILLRGPNVFAGYWGSPTATAEALRDGWLHTGDVGAIEDGFIRITDRKKDIIITAGGKNVTPSNIENGLKESPYVSEVCVIGDRRPYLVAVVTVDVDALAPWAEAHDVAARGEALRRDPVVRELVQGEIDRVNAQHGRAEQVRRFAVLDAEFSQESGELTPTLKLKRQVVVERYAAEIERLYA